MKKIFFVSVLLLSVFALSGAEKSFNYLKAFFRPYPKDPAITLQSKINGSSRLLIYTVGEPKAMTSLYTYAPVSPGKKLTLSFLYKVADYQAGKKASARIQLNFQDSKGKAIKGAKAHTAPLALKNTNGKYVKAATTFDVPENAEDPQLPQGADLGGVGPQGQGRVDQRPERYVGKLQPDHGAEYHHGHGGHGDNGADPYQQSGDFLSHR